MFPSNIVLLIVCIFFVICVVLGDKIPTQFLRQHGPPPREVDHTREGVPEWGNIVQKLDHFNPTDARTWDMRFMNNSFYFQEGGPLVIYLGGEWEISAGYIQNGLIVDIAKEHNGYLFYTEHRYYGKSNPFPDMSTESLQYLSVDQALADVAYFIEYAKTNIPGLANSKVIVMGASYSAEMATWMRSKYPHLVDAAWASSAPLKAQIDFPEYYEVVSDNIKLVDEECWKTLEVGSQMMIEALRTEAGVATVSELINTCKLVRMDGMFGPHFYNTVTEIFASLVQYAWPGRIAEECQKIKAIPGSDMAKMLGYIKAQYNGGCIGDYDDFLRWYATPEINGAIYRQWNYQICTEFGYLQTTTSRNQPFGYNTVTPEFFYQTCQDLFGVNFDAQLMAEAVNRTNLVYGGKTPVLSNVVSIHGSVDPWHTPGILESLHEDAPAMLVQGYAHCQDMGSVSTGDAPEMQAAKKLIVESIAKWIQ